MTTKQKKLSKALQISKIIRKMEYYRDAQLLIGSNRINLLSSSFEIRVRGIKGSVFGEFTYEDALFFLNKKCKEEEAKIHKLL